MGHLPSNNPDQSVSFLFSYRRARSKASPDIHSSWSNHWESDWRGTSVALGSDQGSRETFGNGDFMSQNIAVDPVMAGVLVTGFGAAELLRPLNNSSSSSTSLSTMRSREKAMLGSLILESLKTRGTPVAAVKDGS